MGNDRGIEIRDNEVSFVKLWMREGNHTRQSRRLFWNNKRRENWICFSSELLVKFKFSFKKDVQYITLRNIILFQAQLYFSSHLKKNLQNIWWQLLLISDQQFVSVSERVKGQENHFLEMRQDWNKYRMCRFLLQSVDFGHKRVMQLWIWY